MIRPTTFLLAALIPIFLLTGCEFHGAAQGIQNLVNEGLLTPEQGRLALEAVSNGGSDWWVDALQILGGAVLAWFGIRLPPGMLPGVSRGAATQTIGLPKSMVHPDGQPLGEK